MKRSALSSVSMWVCQGWISIDAELHQGDEIPDGAHGEQLFLVLGVLHRADAALQGLLRMALEKALAGDAVRVAHHRYRPVAHVQQQRLRHPLVVARDVELGRARGRIDHPRRMRDLDAGDRVVGAGLDPGLLERLAMAGNLRVQSSAGAGDQLGLAVLDPPAHAIAVELHLVDPVGTARRRIDQRGEFRLDDGRQLAALAALVGLDGGDVLFHRRLGAGGIPDRAVAFRDLAHAAAGLDAGRVLDRGVAMAGLGPAVVLLDQQPVVPDLPALALIAVRHADEAEAALQALALEVEGDVALLVRLGRVALRLPGAAVPQHHGAAAILALRDGAFERAVFDRMILDLDRQPAVLGIEAGSARDGPALVDAVDLQPEVIVQAARRMHLDDVSAAARRRPPAPLGSGVTAKSRFLR